MNSKLFIIRCGRNRPATFPRGSIVHQPPGRTGNFADWGAHSDITGAAAIVLQAVVFGIAHAYQGGRRIILIAVYGALFGMLAAWRKSLRPGMIGHAMQDSFSGIAFRLLK